MLEVNLSGFGGGSKGDAILLRRGPLATSIRYPHSEVLRSDIEADAGLGVNSDLIRRAADGCMRSSHAWNKDSSLSWLGSN